MKNPDEGQIVIVPGGTAQFREGLFYTGMEYPQYSRVIMWLVPWWIPIEADLSNHASLFGGSSF